MPITGLGPHGERATPANRLKLSSEDQQLAQDRRFSVAIVLHTARSDWSNQQMAGIVGTLGDCAAVVTEVVDCGFDAPTQIAALERLGRAPVDAIISVPVANATVAEAHRQVARASIKLILHDNVPTGLLPGSDYTSLVSADNFGLGLIAAELLAAHIPPGREIVLLAYGEDFYATNEREIAFGRWMLVNRPDIKVRTVRFAGLDTAGEAALTAARAHPGIAGMFVVWDTPAIGAIAALEASGFGIPVTTVDLGNDAAVLLSQGRQIVGIAAQQPYWQGVAVAEATILAMLGRIIPSWVALPGLAVTRQNVAEMYQTVWRAQAPRDIIDALK
ncbi:MAG: substrate-binding domain-containing protein [Rhodobacteraceae bacterium]|nr:substrate-binding domain-containing protein [Paracoccaceae bacterium]